MYVGRLQAERRSEHHTHTYTQLVKCSAYCCCLSYYCHRRSTLYSVCIMISCFQSYRLVLALDAMLRVPCTFLHQSISGSRKDHVQLRLSLCFEFCSVHWHCWLGDGKGTWPVKDNNNNRLTALCPGLREWTGTRRNIHPPTILIIIQSISFFHLLRSIASSLACKELVIPKDFILVYRPSQCEVTLKEKGRWFIK